MDEVNETGDGKKRGGRLPAEVRDKLRTEVLELHRGGLSARHIADAVGLGRNTVTRWLTETIPAPRFLPVQTAARQVAASPHHVLITPGGYRIEGLALADVILLLRNLG